MAVELQIATETLIMKALADHLESLVFDQNIPIHHMGVNADPVDSGHWIETNYFPAPNQEMGMENDPQIFHSGIFQVGVGDQPGQGVLAATEIAGKISSHFSKGTSFKVFGVEVKINRKPQILSPLIIDNKIIVPIQIRYNCSQ